MAALEFLEDRVRITVSDADTTLADEHIRGVLAVLESTGEAERDGNVFTLENEVFCALDSADRSIIGAPESFPYRSRIESKRDLSSRDFRLEHDYVDKDGSPVGAVERKGCLAIVGDRQYVLSPSEYLIATEVEAINSVSGRGRTEMMARRYEHLARIKEQADKAHAMLDSYIEKTEVSVPDRLLPRVDIKDDGCVEVTPDPLVDDGRVLRDEEQRQYTSKTVDNRFPRRVVKVRGSDGSRRVVVNSPRIKKGFSEMKPVRKLPREAAADFLENPHSYLPEDVFELDRFSERVIDVAEIRFRTNPGVSKGRMKIDWDSLGLDFEGASGTLSIEELDLNRATELRMLENALNRARETDQEDIVFRGSVLECDLDDLEEFIESRRDYLIAKGEISGDTEAAEQRLSENDRIDPSKLGLKIYDNIDETSQYTESGSEEEYVNADLPTSLRDEIELYGFQEAGYHWLNKQRASRIRGALLADDMGLGKTLQVLCYIVSGIEQGEGGPFLVVAPVSLLDNWKNELQQMFSPRRDADCLKLHREFLTEYGRKGARIRKKDGSVVALPGKKSITPEGMQIIQSSDIVFTNYATVRSYALSLGQIDFSAIVLDEAQKVKNPTTHVTNAVKAMNGRFRVATTATPVENSLVDLWCIADFLSPGVLGTLSSFKKAYEPSADSTVDRESIEELRASVDRHRLILRRTKEGEDLGLPNKLLQKMSVDFGPRQRALYSEHIDAARRGDEAVIAIIGRLIKICSHPAMAEGEDIRDYSIQRLLDECPKLADTMGLLRSIADRSEKALVFTRYRRMQQILFETITTAFPGTEPAIINGVTPAHRRQSIVDRFNGGPGFDVLILSPEAAGVGLNITGANHVIHYTRLWNPAKEDQATDRAYRIGQTKDVHVYLPITRDEVIGKTIEEHIDELLSEKRRVINTVLVPTSEAQFSERDILKRMMGR